MSDALETLLRLRAWEQGKPINRGQRVNVAISDDEDIMSVAFLRMGGESRPWGVAFGNPGSPPTVLSVPDGRDQTLVGDTMVILAKALLEFFRHPGFSTSSPDNFEVESARQIWLPGPTHIEMLHFLALTYAKTRFKRDDVEVLQCLGNLANCLYIEHQRPGQQIVISAAAALRECFVFPSAAIRQAHLGHLLGWLKGGSSRADRIGAATRAEEQSVATMLNPELERSSLEPLVDRWNEAKVSGNKTDESESERAISRLLTKELISRWNLTNDAIAVLRADQRKSNSGLSELVKSGARQFHELWGSRAVKEYDGDIPYWPNVYTDTNSKTSAFGYIMRNAANQEARARLVHGDRELQREQLAAGHGVIARVVSVSAAAASWRLQYSYPPLPTIEPGDYFVIAGSPTEQFVVRSVDLESREMEIEPQWKKGNSKANPPKLGPTDSSWKGRELVLLDDAPFSLTRNLAFRARKRTTGVSDILDLVQPYVRNQATNDELGAMTEVGESE